MAGVVVIIEHESGSSSLHFVKLVDQVLYVWIPYSAAIFKILSDKRVKHFILNYIDDYASIISLSITDILKKISSLSLYNFGKILKD